VYTFAFPESSISINLPLQAHCKRKHRKNFPVMFYLIKDERPAFAFRIIIRLPSLSIITDQVP
jgi:hypothetical protein